MGTQENEVLLAVKIWIAAAWADGVIASEEEHAIKAVVSAAKLGDDDKKTARGWLASKISLDDIALSQVSPENRENIFACAVGVMHLENQLADAEQKFLARLQTALELDDETAASLRADSSS